MKRVLEGILASKRAELSVASTFHVETSYEPEGLVLETLRRLPGQPLRLVAEIKPRSPSAGQLSTALSIEDRAQAYAEAGAAMISVLVDKPFFGGSYEHLSRCRQSLDARYGTARPRLLGKEFILDPVQLAWAAAAGADAVLLIARIVTTDELRRLVDEALARGLEPLVEVTTEAELQNAQSTKTRMIGVNARDLDTLEINAERAAEVLTRIESSRVRMFLSGLVLPDDVGRIARGSADAALVGEALMRQDDPTALLSEMVRRAKH